MSLAGKVCVVTGASRGIGKGIALQLGESGATVYITGRSLAANPGNPVGGCLNDTAKEIETRGGRCIPVQCDHSNDADVRNLFEKIKKEQDGQLDLLVNNAYAAVKAIGENMGIPFWEQPVSMWDTVNNVGLRNHYLCSVYAAQLMVPRKRGLIINVSSGGGMRYLFNVSYGVGKEACDRMAADCAIELRKHNVAFVSLWPGAVLTETIELKMKTWEVCQGMFNVYLLCYIGTMYPGRDHRSSTKLSHKYQLRKSSKEYQLFEGGESTEYAGKAVARLATDPQIMKKSGKILMTSELGNEYGFNDIDGRNIGSFRQINKLLSMNPKTVWLSKWIPDCVKLPYWMFAMAGNKF